MSAKGLASPAAALVAAVAWAGLALQFNATFGKTHDVPAALWALLRFFTIISNLAVAVIFTAIASGYGIRRATSLVAGLSLAILLVGVVYALLLEGREHLTGTAIPANVLLHKVTPVLVPLWWLIFVPKGRLNGSAPLRWALFPSAYLPYALVRGTIEGRYPYPFLNVAKFGGLQVAINCLGIAAGFLIAGYALVLLDRAMGKLR
jgi:hypothetical protein